MTGCIMVIFGAGGDLTKRKLIPALYHLSHRKLLPTDFAIIGTARTPVKTEDFRKNMLETLRKEINASIYSEALAKDLIDRCHYLTSDGKTYSELTPFIESICKKYQIPTNLLFYLAVPPHLFHQIPPLLATQGLLRQNQSHWRRIIFEKPFGHDLQSAQQLNADLARVMTEDQIYRIDHYLGKETVQNIMALRFANGIFEPLWNRKYIDSVQMTVAEELGVENRATYYEGTGALRDMVPNHLFQLVSLIGMEPPNSFSAKDVRDEKVKVLCAIKPIKNAVRGQYRGYRNEKQVHPNSQTETFVALKLEIDNWRWAGTPFYLRTGKRMPKRITEISISFNCAPFQMFSKVSVPECIHPNILKLQIQPKEQIILQIAGKIPGPGMEIGVAPLRFNSVEVFGGIPETGYETLLYDCMKGDASLFQRADQIETAWSIVSPILKLWDASKTGSLPQVNPFPLYSPGSWGPREADELIRSDGRQWINPTTEIIPREDTAARQKDQAA